MEILKQTNFAFLGKKWPFIIASLVLTAAGLISLAVKGGPRYGIDFRGGTVTTVRFANKTNEDQIRKALSAKIPGEIIVQQDTVSKEVIISTELRDERELNAARSLILETLKQNFGGIDGNKLDFSGASNEALAERLRGKLGSSFNEQQTQDLAKALTAYRDKQRSGLIGNLDELSAVNGVSPQVIPVLKQETFVAPYQVRGFDLVGPKVGAELRGQA